MEQLTITDKAITRHHSLSAAIANLDDTRNIIHVRLLAKARVKAKCREYLNGEIIEEYENGDFEYSFSVPENESFWYGVILSCGSDIQILEPQNLIERMVTTCKEILEKYGGKCNE